MGLKALSQLVMGGVKAVKTMPTVQKAAMAALFGAGMLTGNLTKCSDEFEKQQPKAEEPKTEVKADTTKVTKPEAKEEKPKFVYEPPVMGENGIEKTDTLFFDKTKQPKEINYRDADKKVVHSAEFNRDGSLKGFTNHYTTTDDSELYQNYDSNGKKVSQSEFMKNGNYRWDSFGDKYRYEIHDSKGRVIEDYYDGYTVKIKYNPDGSRVETSYKYDVPTEQITYNKNGVVIQKKEYDNNGVLKHTINPKFNKDGDVVKNDTIKNIQ